MTKLAPNRVVQETPSDLSHLPVFEAYGDTDDHLRLSVLLASSFQSNARGVGLAREAEICRDPGTSWSRRLEAVDHLLREASPQNGDYLGVLLDLDALDPGPLDAETRWDDRDFRGARLELFQRLVQALPRGGWVVVRPNPSADLALPGDPTSRPSSRADVDSVLVQLAPECRPVADWLLRRGVLAPNQIKRRFLASEENPMELGRHLISVVYDALTEPAAQAALRISLVRPAQSYNGKLGAFLLADADTVDIARTIYEEEHCLVRGAVEDLLDCGFLQRSVQGSVRMPRAVRSFLERRASAVYPEVAGSIHRWLSLTELEQGDVVNETEAHFHAIEVSPVCAADIERARSTARYYASTLREMAVRLSVIERRWTDAAALFEGIVQQDPTDAYAWEYLGYNLARGYEGKPVPSREADRIEKAYWNATFYNPGNPLYEGRLIGFLARMGGAVEAMFDEKLRTHLRPGAPPEGVSYFAKTALAGMSREQRRKVIVRWGNKLSEHKELEPLLSEAE